MRTENQIEASRINGAKSHGPTTEEGKLASSRNAVTHGLASAATPHTDIALANEGQQCVDDLLHELENEFQPQTAFEQSLIEAMAVARYRQWRIWAIEKASLDHEMRTQSALWNSSARMEGATPVALAFKSLSDNSRSLDLMNRYEARYERQYFRAHRRLLEVQDRRDPSPAQPMPVPVTSPELEPNLPETKTEFTERTQGVLSQHGTPAGASLSAPAAPTLDAEHASVFVRSILEKPGVFARRGEELRVLRENSVGKPDAGNRHVRFKEPEVETEQSLPVGSHRASPRLYKLRQTKPICKPRRYNRDLLRPCARPYERVRARHPAPRTPPLLARSATGF